MICARCNRFLLRPPVMRGGMAFGPRCAALVGAARAPRTRKVHSARTAAADPRQTELFQGAPA